MNHNFAVSRITGKTWLSSFELSDEICSQKWKRKEIIHGKWKSSVNVIIFLCLSQLKDMKIHHPYPHCTLNLLSGPKQMEMKVMIFIVSEQCGDDLNYSLTRTTRLCFVITFSLMYYQLHQRSWWLLSRLIDSDGGKCPVCQEAAKSQSSWFFEFDPFHRGLGLLQLPVFLPGG